MAQGAEVVKDVDAAAEGGDDEVAEAGLDGEPGDGGVGQVELQGVPVLAVVEGEEDAVLGGGVEEAGAGGVLLDAVDGAEKGVGDAAADGGPGGAVVGGFVDEGIVVALEVVVGGEVGGGGGGVGGLDVADGGPAGQAGDMGSDIGPGEAAVAGEVDEAVVAADPDEARLAGGCGDAPEGGAVEAKDIVAGDAAGVGLVRGIVAGEVGADGAPTGAAVGGGVEELAADVDLVVVEGGEGDGKSPVPAVLDPGGRPAVGGVGIDADVAGLEVAEVEAVEAAAVAAGIDDLVVGGVGDGEAAFAAADGDLGAGIHAAAEQAAGDAPTGAVLLVGVDEVGTASSGRASKSWAMGRATLCHSRPRSRVRRRRGRRDQDAVGIGGIDPEVVVVAADGQGVLGGTAVAGEGDGDADEVDAVWVAGIDGEAGVVGGALGDLVGILVDEAPGGAAVAGAVEAGVAVLDQGVHAAAVAGGDADGDLADGAGEQAVAGRWVQSSPPSWER